MSPRSVLIASATILSIWGIDAFTTTPMGTALTHRHLSSRESATKASRKEFSSNTCLKMSLFEPRSSKVENPFANNQGAMMAIAALFILFSPTPPAWAVDDPTIFTGWYNDPNHPMCQRKIKVSEDGKSFRYTGTTVGSKDDPVRRGCSDAEIKVFGLQKGAFEGIIIGDKISVGDGVHEGIWEPKQTATDMSLSGVEYNGIRWNDGNKWEKIEVKDIKDSAYGKGFGDFQNYGL